MSESLVPPATAPAPIERPVEPSEDAVPIPTVPREVAAYGAPIPQLAVGRAGKVGVLHLGFEDRGGITRLTHSFARAPLQAHRALHLDPSLPGMAFVYVISTGGGILQGDRLGMRVEVGSGAQVHLTTQAATKVYRMEHDYAVQAIDLRVGPDAYLEWIPDALIPYRQARLYQAVNLHVAPSGSLLYWEVLLPGREGERFQYDILYNRVQAFQGERKIFGDTLCLQPAQRSLTSLGLLGEFSVLGTLYAVTARLPARRVADELQAAASAEGVLAGASTLPGDAGAILRCLGHGSSSVQRSLHAAWDRARQLLLGCPAPDQRKL